MSANDVRQRHSDSFGWIPAETGMPIFQGDSIFTGSKSEAIIETEGGERILISANSLFVINRLNEGLKLEMNYGRVRGEVAKDRSIMISSNGEVTEFKGDDAVINIDVSEESGLSVRVLEGHIEVKSKEGTQTLGQAERTELKESQKTLSAEEIRLMTISPVTERRVRPDESKDLKLIWSSEPDFSEYEIEISRDPEFKKIILKDKTQKTQYAPTGLPLNEKLYWRIGVLYNPNQKVHYSNSDSFLILEDVAPKIIFPKDTMVLAYEDLTSQKDIQVEGMDVIATWKSKVAVSKWEIQVSESPDFQKLKMTLESNETFVRLPNLKESNYYLRCRSKDWSSAQWSEALFFNVSKKSPASYRSPEPVELANEVDLFFKFDQESLDQIRLLNELNWGSFIEEPPIMAWNTIAGAAMYEIEISNSEKFEEVIERQQITTTRFQWMKPRLGSYFWRVRALTSSGTRGPTSEPVNLFVRLGSPKSLIEEIHQEEVTTLSQMDSIPSPFLLRWSPIPTSSGYELEFDKEPTFVKPLRVFTKNPFKKVQAPQAGMYHWRVRALNNSNAPITEWSEIFNYKFEKIYLSPETTKELTAVYPNDETIMLIGSGELKINFRWVSPLSSQRLRFQLSRDKKFQKTIKDFLTENDFYLHQQKMADGWYYWRVRIENSRFTSPWTNPFPFQIQHVNSPFSFERSEREKEQEILEYNQKKNQILAEYERKKIKSSEEIARLDIQKRPQLEQPLDLVFPEEFEFEAKELSSGSRPLEQIPVEEQFPLLKDYPTLDWAPVNGATDYRIEISTTQNFTKPIISESIGRPSYRWLNPRPGKYFWRVQAKARGYRDSPLSEVGSFILNSPKAKLITPHALLANQSENGPVVLLKWKSVPFANKYEVQWSSTQDFKSANEITTSTPKALMPIASDSLVFWRVKPLFKDNTWPSEFSHSRPIQVALPTRLPASNGPQLTYPATDFFLKAIDDESPRIAFSWLGSDRKAQFTLEIAKDKDFNDLIQSLSTKNRMIVAETPITGKSLFWRLKSSRDGKLIWTSETRKISIERKPTSNASRQKKIRPKNK